MLSIFYGTRPEYIKIKPLFSELESQNVPFEVVKVTQHTDLIENCLHSRQIHINYDFYGHQNRLNRICTGILEKEQSSQAVLVMGDTTTAFAVALSAFHHQVPVIHLEAGLRSFDMQNPFPEEFNRRSISLITDLHLCPTEKNRENLNQELVQGAKVVTGNTGLDNLLLKGMPVLYSEPDVLVTIHRAENTDNFREWLNTIRSIADKNKNLKFRVIKHPRHDDQLYASCLSQNHIFGTDKNIEVLPPVSHYKLLEYLATSQVVVSDSGGLQEEASFFKKFIMICRKTTERPEILPEGGVLLGSPEELKNNFHKYLNFKVTQDCPFGDGKSAPRVVKAIKEFMKEK